ncbi:hypothetical protein, partial [Kitasatospora sp. NPDC005751]|uniref:hypothetical protein n=1 Tax=Kitasatospora sp. NPDC005751 TaxID=3157064 RepID=UPI0033E4EC06
AGSARSRGCRRARSRRRSGSGSADPGRGGRDGDPGLARLGRLELRGLLRGPFSYLVSRRQDRRFRAEDWS